MSYASRHDGESRNVSGNVSGGWFSWACYVCGCILALAVALGYLQRPHATWGTFGTFWASGRAANQGLNPYAAYPETFRPDYSMFGGPSSFPDVNLNPPCVLPLIQALSHLSIQQFAAVWMIATYLLFAAGAGLLLWQQPRMQGRQILWLLLSAPVFNTILSGQIYGLLFFLAALAWLFKKNGNDTGAAICMGLFVSARPTMAFWPALVLLAGHRKIAVRSAVVVAAVCALPVFLYGTTIYYEWFAAFANDYHWLAPSNIALMPLFRRIGMPVPGIVAAIVVAALLGSWAWKSRPDFLSASGVGLCAGMLCAPLAWFDYAVFLAPLFTARRWNWLSTAAACILMLPPALTLGTHSCGLYLVATLIILSFFLGAGGRVRIFDPVSSPFVLSWWPPWNQRGRCDEWSGADGAAGEDAGLADSRADCGVDGSPRRRHPRRRDDRQ